MDTRMTILITQSVTSGQTMECKGQEGISLLPTAQTHGFPGNIDLQCRWETDWAKGDRIVARSMIHTYSEVRNLKESLFFPAGLFKDKRCLLRFRETHKGSKTPDCE